METRDKNLENTITKGVVKAQIVLTLISIGGSILLALIFAAISKKQTPQ